MKRWKRDLGIVRELGPDTPAFAKAVQRVWDEIEAREREVRCLQDLILDDAAAELERVKARTGA